MSISQLPPAQQEFILNGPALNPPSGMMPNFENPPNQNALFLSVVIICLSLSTIACLIRAYAKVLKTRLAKLEDGLGLFGFLAYAAYVGTSIWRLKHRGAFIHQWDVRLRDLTDLLLVAHISTNFYSATMLTIKSAILIEWRALFVPTGTRNTFYWACSILLAFNVLYYSAGIIAANLACIPYRAIWDITISGRCISQRGLIVSGSSINLLSDFAILLLPQRVIWGLNITAKKKLGVSVAFAIGLFGVISAIARLEASVVYFRSDDSIYEASKVSLWAIAEMTCAFLVFCVPSFPRAFNGEGMLTRLAASVRSWRSVSRMVLTAAEERGDESDSKPSSGSSTIRLYQKVDDNNIPLDEMSSTRLVRITGDSNSPANMPSGVLYTKQFTAEEQYTAATTDLDKNASQKQHPWEGRPAP